MRVERHVELAGELSAGAEDLLGARVRRMRRHGRNDQGMRLPSRNEVARSRQRVFEAAGIGRGELQHRLTAQGAHACRRRGRRHRFLEVVHVGEAGCARSDHLRAGEAGAELDEVGTDELALDRHHVTEEPDIEAQVVGHASQQRHWRMRVCVDKARHDNPPRTVDRLARFVLFPCTADPDDLVPADRNRPGRMHGVVVVHGQDVCVGEQNVAGGAHVVPLC
jgi:hypothetical protein